MYVGSFTVAERAALVLSQAAINAGIAKTFDISKPSAMAMYTVGYTTSMLALNSLSNDPVTFIPSMFLSHLVGNAVAKETTGVNVTFADQLNLFGASLITAVPFVVQSAVLFPKAFEAAAQGFAGNNATRW